MGRGSGPNAGRGAASVAGRSAIATPWASKGGREERRGGQGNDGRGPGSGGQSTTASGRARGQENGNGEAGRRDAGASPPRGAARPGRSGPRPGTRRGRAWAGRHRRPSHGASLGAEGGGRRRSRRREAASGARRDRAESGQRDEGAGEPRGWIGNPKGCQMVGLSGPADTEVHGPTPPRPTLGQVGQPKARPRRDAQSSHVVPTGLRGAGFPPAPPTA